MSGCIFKKTYPCKHCFVREQIEKAYQKNKEVEYKKRDEKNKNVFIFNKGFQRPEKPTLILPNECACD